MKKQIIIIVIGLIIITAISGYYVYNARKIENLARKNNEQYENYYNQEILGTDLISIINKTIDYNEKNNIEKNDIYYINNSTNSIQITIKFLEDERNIKMEDIANATSESFIKYFATASFKCTKLEYHEKTKYIKSLYFEQMSN